MEVAEETEGTGSHGETEKRRKLIGYNSLRIEPLRFTSVTPFLCVLLFPPYGSVRFPHAWFRGWLHFGVYESVCHRGADDRSRVTRDEGRRDPTICNVSAQRR